MRRNLRRRDWMAVGLLITVPLALVIVTAIARWRQSAREAACLDRARRLALAALCYVCSNDERLPPVDWCDKLRTPAYPPGPPALPPRPGGPTLLVGDLSLFRCPEASGLRCGFAYNPRVADCPLWAVADPAKTVLLIEADKGWNGLAGPGYRPPLRHPGGVVVAWADGHVKLVPADGVSRLNWEPKPRDTVGGGR